MEEMLAGGGGGHHSCRGQLFPVLLGDSWPLVAQTSGGESGGAGSGRCSGHYGACTF